MFFFFFSPTRDGMPGHVREFLDKDHLTWDEMERLLQGFRTLKPDITVGTLVTFFHIARRTAVDVNQSQISIKSISDALNMNYQSVARYCDLLSDGVGSAQGLQWIEKSSNPEQRGKALTLSYGGLYALMQVVGDILRMETDLPQDKDSESQQDGKPDKARQPQS